MQELRENADLFWANLFVKSTHENIHIENQQKTSTKRKAEDTSDENNRSVKVINKSRETARILHDKIWADIFMKSIKDNNQIAVKYCDHNGDVSEKNNPNGALENIAGIFNKEKNILGMMPHPERMIDKSLSGEDGSIFFKNLLQEGPVAILREERLSPLVGPEVSLGSYSLLSTR